MMKRHRLSGFMARGLLWSALAVLVARSVGALEDGRLEDEIFYPDLIDTLDVVDSLSEETNGRIRTSDLQLNPSCLYQDVFKYTLATEPSISVYGPFSAQLSVNGLRPGDVNSRVDDVLPLYKKDSYHNLFGLPRTDIFTAKLNKYGFPSFEFRTNPKDGHGLCLGLLDFSAFSNLHFSHMGCFNLIRISWLDQMMRRVYDEEYSVFPSFEEYYLKITSDARGNLGHEMNFWFVDQDSYFKTEEFDGVVDEGTEAYQTRALWKSNSRSGAAWYTRNLLASDSFLRAGLSFSYTRREDLAGGKSGLKSERPTELDSHLYFLTMNANAVLDGYSYVNGLEVQHGIRCGQTSNHMKVDSEGIYYPAIYTLQRGDEYTPDKLMKIDEKTNAFDYETWFRIRKDFCGYGFHVGVRGLYRTRFPFAFGPEIQADIPAAIGRLTLFIGRSQRFPGAERAHVSMYPLEGSIVEINDNVTVGFHGAWWSMTSYFSRLYDLYDPVDENSIFAGDYADGYSTGAEFKLEKSLAIFSINMGYSYGRSILSREGMRYFSSYDPGHRATCVIVCRICDSFSLNLAGDGGQGQRITPLRGRELTEDGYRPLWGRPNSARLPINWGASFGMNFKIKKNFDVSLYLTDIPGRKFAIVYDDWQTKNFVKTHWYGGMKVGYDF